MAALSRWHPAGGLLRQMRAGRLRRFRLLLLGLLQTLSFLGIKATRLCCEPPPPSVPGEDFTSDFSGCTCLQDNVPLVRERVVGGADNARHYHWRLSDWELINVPDSERARLHLRLEPCEGSPMLYVMPMWTPFPTPYNYRWGPNVSVVKPGEGMLNFVEVPLYYADYYVTVFAESNATYTLTAITKPRMQVLPPTNGTLGTEGGQVMTVNQTSASAGTVKWLTSDDPDATYRVFFVHQPVSNEKCGTGDNATKDACIMWTSCGMEDHGVPSDEGGYESFPPNTVVTKDITGLLTNEEYFFNIAIKSKAGLLTSYEGVTGNFSYEQKKKLSSESQDNLVYGIVGGLAFICVCVLIYARLRLKRAYKLKPSKFGFREKDVNWREVAEKRRALRKSGKAKPKDGRAEGVPPPRAPAGPKPPPTRR